MLLTMFLLGLVYVVFVGVLFAAGAGAGIIVVVAVVLLVLQLFTSDKIALATLGAKEVSPAEEPELHGIVERLCVQANLPKPRVCVMRDLDAQRLRDGPLEEVRHRVRHQRHPRSCWSPPSSKA